VAGTAVFAVIVTVHAAVPVQAPDHPAKVEPEKATAVSVTCDPVLKLALHVVPQLIPAGLLVTVPEPVPLACTLSWTMCTGVGVMDAPPQPTARTSEAGQTQRKRRLGMGSCPTFIVILKRTVSKCSFDEAERGEVVQRQETA